MSRRRSARARVKDFNELVDDRLRTDHDLVVIGSEMARDFSGMRRLVHRRIFKPDRVGLELAGNKLLRMCGDQTGIDPSAQETAQWHIADQSAGNGVVKRRFQRLRSSAKIDIVLLSGGVSGSAQYERTDNPSRFKIP